MLSSTISSLSLSRLYFQKHKWYRQIWRFQTIIGALFHHFLLCAVLSKRSLPLYSPLVAEHKLASYFRRTHNRISKTSPCTLSPPETSKYHFIRLFSVAYSNLLQSALFPCHPFSDVSLYCESKKSYPRPWNNLSVARRFWALPQSSIFCIPSLSAPHYYENFHNSATKNRSSGIDHILLIYMHHTGLHRPVFDQHCQQRACTVYTIRILEKESTAQAYFHAVGKFPFPPPSHFCASSFFSAAK